MKKTNRCKAVAELLCLCLLLTACRSGNAVVSSEGENMSAERQNADQLETELQETDGVNTEGENNKAEQENTREKQEDKKQQQTENTLPENYVIPEGWILSELYTTKDKKFYVEEGREKDELPDNISVNMGENPYPADEHTAFRDSIYRQLAAQVKGQSGVMLYGDEPLRKKAVPCTFLRLRRKIPVWSQDSIIS